ncbi:hypothetical protein BJ912DRAFT_924111 [Pholiota molesta]|nr:hypothetical protein BJ912DRAFT_924111 [Pholiota molesta]
MDSRILNAFIIPMEATKYATVASICLIMWDMALTLDEELSKIWLAQRSTATILFFINRYMPPAVLVLDLYSAKIINYPRRYWLSPQLQWSNMTIGYMLLTSVNAVGPAAAITIGLSGCIANSQNGQSRQSILASFWVPFFSYETVIFSLTLAKSFQRYKLAYKFPTYNYSTPNLLQVLVRDGILYYLVIMSVSLCNLLMWALYPGASYLAVGLLKSLQAVICSRLLLNLRRPAVNVWTA